MSPCTELFYLHLHCRIEELNSQDLVPPCAFVFSTVTHFVQALVLVLLVYPPSFASQDLYLYYFLSRYPGRTLVFSNTVDCVRRLGSLFRLLNFDPWVLHASMQQRQRLKNLDRSVEIVSCFKRLFLSKSVEKTAFC